MRKIVPVLTGLLLLGFGNQAAADWQLTFGRESGQVGVTVPANAEDLPVGPSSFRGVGQDLWVLDSVKGRVICLDGSGSIKKEVVLPKLKPEFILSDFALQTGQNNEVTGVVALDMMAREIVVANGEGVELRRIAADGLIQLDEIDIDNKGQIYVGDYASAKIAVYSAAGKLLRTFPWQASGFCVDENDNLHMLDYSEALGHSLVTLSASGAEIARQTVGMVDMQNPRIWQVGPGGERLVSFVAPAGDPTQQTLIMFAAAGEVVGKTVFTSPYYINRYLACAAGKFWLVRADYSNPFEVPIKVEPVSISR